jgi:hypothetical protein
MGADRLRYAWGYAPWKGLYIVSQAGSIKSINPEPIRIAAKYGMPVGAPLITSYCLIPAVSRLALLDMSWQRSFCPAPQALQRP